MVYASIILTALLLYIVFTTDKRLKDLRSEKLKEQGRNNKGQFINKYKPISKHYVKCFYMGEEKEGFYIYD